ncbi:MAG TPA: TlpA disulfide reductase family protein [Thermoanaerobaculia bacterium]|nr:TlpA disulfide reductase family protein [Thermoanaerobaculia bacterium]
MRSKLFSLVLVASLLGALLLPDGATAAKAKVGSLAPTFSLTTLAGEKLTSADLEGKVVLLDFWATWCKPCVMAIPELKALNEEMKGKPFVMISFSADQKQATLEQFVKENGMTWPQHWDEKGEIISRTFGISTFPTYIVVDSEGKVVLHEDGWGPDTTDKKVRAAIDKALLKARPSWLTK